LLAQETLICSGGKLSQENVFKIGGHWFIACLFLFSIIFVLVHVVVLLLCG